jgi:manganese-dependent ADP-ribose/CDP-alcohol diphosphatase
MRPARGWKVIVLDAYDVSVYGNGRGEGLDRAAVELLCEHNPNCARWVEDNPDVFETERMSGTFPYFQGLEGLGTRWVPFNGAVSEAQLRWLREELVAAKAAAERVVVFSHLLVHPASTAKGSGRTLLWNYDAVLAVLEDDAYAANVSAVVSGHQHEGGLHTSEAGTHYVVMESPMLATPGRKGPWCVVEARGDSIDFVGYGRGPESKVFPDDMAGEEGVGDVEDAAPSVRRLPLRPVG